MTSIPLLFLLSLSLSLSASTSATNFTCNATAMATCEALVNFAPANATTLAAVQALFQLPSLSSLLGPNSLPPATPPSHTVPAQSPIRVPIPCACSRGVGVSNHTPNYTVKKGDGLDFIARTLFGGLLVYQDIARANGIPNPNLIQVGQKLWIPLPCSCDPVAMKEVVHLAYVVPGGSSMAGIAAEFGVEEQTLQGINGIADPKSLMAGAVLDVPLPACSSSISSDSPDHNLRLPNGSYALTANDCILCSCSSSSYQLGCRPSQANSSQTCPSAMCRSLSLGDTTGSGCNQATCSYTGYTNVTSFRILTNLTIQSTCGGSPVPSPGSSPPNGAAGLGLNLSWTGILFHMILACFALWQ